MSTRSSEDNKSKLQQSQLRITMIGGSIQIGKPLNARIEFSAFQAEFLLNSVNPAT